MITWSLSHLNSKRRAGLLLLTLSDWSECVTVSVWTNERRVERGLLEWAASMGGGQEITVSQNMFRFNSIWPGLLHHYTHRPG